MKKIILSVICSFIFVDTSGQSAKELYLEGVRMENNDSLEEAIVLFRKAVELQPGDYYYRHNIGLAHSKLGYFEEALKDFNKVIKLAPSYKNAYLNRGITKKRMTDYEGAIADYNIAIKLDPEYSDAYYNRGVVYEMLKEKDLACADFSKAKAGGSIQAGRKVENCNDTSNVDVHPILRLTKKAKDKKYGFTPEQPVMVGIGPDGGPANQRAYFNLLRDPSNRPVKYKRKGSCCDYESKNGVFGRAKLDQYEITYLNRYGKEKADVIYVSFYDYEEPRILFGFKTVSKRKINTNEK